MEMIASTLNELLHPHEIFELGDMDTRLREKLPPCVSPMLSDAPPEKLTITEYGLKFFVNVWRGHKTDFYLDQKDNRRRSSPYLVGERVLNTFSYRQLCHLRVESRCTNGHQLGHFR